jgi:hypothetical protein
LEYDEIWSQQNLNYGAYEQMWIHLEQVSDRWKCLRWASSLMKECRHDNLYFISHCSPDKLFSFSCRGVSITESKTWRNYLCPPRTGTSSNSSRRSFHSPLTPMLENRPSRGQGEAWESFPSVCAITFLLWACYIEVK